MQISGAYVLLIILFTTLSHNGKPCLAEKKNIQTRELREKKGQLMRRKWVRTVGRGVMREDHGQPCIVTLE